MPFPPRGARCEDSLTARGRRPIFWSRETGRVATQPGAKRLRFSQCDCPRDVFRWCGPRRLPRVSGGVRLFCFRLPGSMINSATGATSA